MPTFYRSPGFKSLYEHFMILCSLRPGFNPWVGKIAWRRQWQTTPVFLPGKSNGWRSLVSYSPWGHKESETTERLHFHFHEYNKIMTQLYIACKICMDMNIKNNY